MEIPSMLRTVACGLRAMVGMANKQGFSHGDGETGRRMGKTLLGFSPSLRLHVSFSCLLTVRRAERVVATVLPR